MSMNTSNSSMDVSKSRDLFVTYYPFTLIIVGTSFNLITLLVLCRPTFHDTNKRPTIHYMRAIAIFDILMLYGWNFDHYLIGAFNFTLRAYSVGFCKIVSFINYFTPQVSAWLRVFICLDRYLSLSRLHKTWFSQSKNVLIIIGSINLVFFIWNSPFFLFVCYTNPDGTVNTGSTYFAIYPLWDMMNLGLYNCAPFVGMVVLNSGVIYHLIRLRQTSTVQNSKIQHGAISVTLVITTCLFLIMTIPATVAFTFFYEASSYVLLQSLDSMLFTYHILSFPLYMITFTEFRQEVIRLVTCRTCRNLPPSKTVTKVTGVPSETNGK
jgi:7 transmembrane receptor (rhodopsin family)